MLNALTTNTDINLCQTEKLSALLWHTSFRSTFLMREKSTIQELQKNLNETHATRGGYFITFVPMTHPY